MAIRLNRPNTPDSPPPLSPSPPWQLRTWKQLERTSSYHHQLLPCSYWGWHQGVVLFLEVKVGLFYPNVRKHIEELH